MCSTGKAKQRLCVQGSQCVCYAAVLPVVVREAQAGTQGYLRAHDAAAAVEVVGLVVEVHAASQALCGSL